MTLKAATNRLAGFIRRPGRPEHRGTFSVPSASRVAVLFTKPDREVARLDIAKGPCVAAAGRKRPMVGPFSQQALTPERIEGLFRILVSDPDATPWEATMTAGKGRLSTLSGPFVDALVDLNKVGRERDAAVRAKGRRLTDQQAEWVLQPELEVASKWIERGDWPPEATTLGVASHFVAWGGWARTARDRGQRLFCWFGPGVPLRTETYARLPVGSGALSGPRDIHQR